MDYLRVIHKLNAIAELMRKQIGQNTFIEDHRRANIENDAPDLQS